MQFIKKHYFLKFIIICILSVVNINNISAISREGRGTADYILDQAFFNYYNNDYGKAIPFFEKHLEVYGPNEVSYRYLAMIHYQSKEYVKCIDVLEKSTKLFPESVTSLNLLAYAYLAENRVEESINTHKKILELDILNENSLSVLATIYANLHNLRTAAGYYKRLIIAVKKKSYDGNLLYKAYSFLGNYYYEEGNYSKAVFYFENLLEISDHDIESMFVLAELYKMTGKFKKAADVLEHTIAIYPDYKTAVESLAEVYYIIGDFKARSLIMNYFSQNKNPASHFKGMLSELNSDYENAELHFRQSAIENKNRLSQYIGLYKIYKKTNNFKEIKKAAFTAAFLFHKLRAYDLSKKYLYYVLDILKTESKDLNFEEEFFIKKAPSPFIIHEHIENLAQDYIETYALQASAYENSENYREAATYYLQSGFYLDKLSEWLNWKKNFLISENNDKSQTQSLEKKIMLIQNKKYEILTSLGWSLQMKPVENYTDALSKMSLAIALDSKQPQAHFITGIILYTLAEQNKASYLKSEEYLSEAIKLARESFGENKVPSGYYFYLGIVQDKSGNFDRAVIHLKKALDIEPYNSSYLNYLGYLYSLKSTKLLEARNLLIKALEDEPENDAYLDSLGWIFFKMEKYKEALDQLLMAIYESQKKGKKDPVIHFHLGETYNKLNNSFKAHYHYSKTMEHIENSSEKLDINYIEKQIKQLSDKK
ncbi:MAG: tetratricopeptide repeat protein [Spirochaetia bacterium]|nr:tetratricopeptide repeat protein [Spirochaetia bacterium]